MTVAPEPPRAVVQEDFSVEVDVVCEEWTSKRTLTLLPSGSVELVDSSGVESLPNSAALEAPGAW